MLRERGCEPRRRHPVLGQISLRWFLALSFVALGTVLVVGYSWLSAHFFVRGMDSIVASNMEQAAVGYLDSVPASERGALGRFGSYWIARQWDAMPGGIRASFPQPPEVLGRLYKQDPSHGSQPPKVLHFATRLRVRGELFFVAESISRATVPKLVARNFIESRRLLLTVSGTIVVTMALIIWLLLWRVGRPVAALGRWTRSLGPSTLKDPAPNFSYPELNALAELIRSSLSSVQDALEREQRFLRHASHELRTPINVIRNNLELLRRLQKDTGRTLEGREAQVIDRIDRASLNMQHSTETLLWLSRESRQMPPGQPFRLDQLIASLVNELEYLLVSKPVAVELNTCAFTVNAPEVLARIVLANLIRNAFQHTREGQVSIVQQGERVEIVNTAPESGETAEDLGFGLGLQLTEQLAERLGWRYLNRAESQHHRVVLQVCEPGVDPTIAD